MPLKLSQLVEEPRVGGDPPGGDDEVYDRPDRPSRPATVRTTMSMTVQTRYMVFGPHLGRALAWSFMLDLHTKKCRAGGQFPDRT